MTVVAVGTGAATVGLQVGCLAIVALYVGLRLRREPQRAVFVQRFVLLMVSSWIAEDTCIRLYGFYAYDPSWWGFIDRVPVLIVAIWPVVIHSAFDLAQAMAMGRAAGAPGAGGADVSAGRRRVALVGALIVLTDAALIEPIAVRVGLWQWSEPGLFAVPPIGVLGWAMFTWLAMGVFADEGRRVGRWNVRAWWVLVVAPVGVHLMLLAAWWGLFRHVNGTVDEVVGVVVAGVVASGLVVRMLWSKRGVVDAAVVMMRGPGAGFFFVLLVLHALDDAWLTAYAVCFAVPWVVLVVRSLRARGAGSGLHDR